MHLPAKNSIFFFYGCASLIQHFSVEYTWQPFHDSEIFSLESTNCEELSETNWNWSIMSVRTLICSAVARVTQSLQSFLLQEIYRSCLQMSSNLLQHQTHLWRREDDTVLFGSSRERGSAEWSVQACWVCSHLLSHQIRVSPDQQHWGARSGHHQTMWTVPGTQSKYMIFNS